MMWRVVWGLSETIASLVPTRVLSKVDLPTLDRPTNVTKPHFRPVFGWFSDYIGRRVFPMLVGAVISLIMMFVLMYTPDLSLTNLILLFFLLGFTTSSQVLSYPALAELNPIALTSTAISIDSVSIMLSGVIFQPFFGWILELNWDHTMVNGMSVYSAQDFLNAMWIMPIGFVLSIFIAWMIKETYCKSQV